MILRDTTTLWELDALDAEPRVVARYPNQFSYFVQGTQRALPFAGTRLSAIRDDLIVVSGESGEPELDVLERGRLVRRIRVERDRDRLTTELLEEFLGMPPTTTELMRDRVAAPYFPESVPAWMQLRIGPAGSIYASRFPSASARSTWDVFDPTGRLTGLLVMPERGSLREIGDALLVVEESQPGAGTRVAVYSYPTDLVRAR